MRMPLVDKIQSLAFQYLPFVRSRVGGTREQMLRLRPMRNTAIEWQENSAGEAELTIPYRTDRLARVLAAVVRLPETRRVQLDEVGTHVWRLCDGTHTVEAIIRSMAREFKMNRAEMEASVARYLQILAERRFIGLYERRGAQ